MQQNKRLRIYLPSPSQITIYIFVVNCGNSTKPFPLNRIINSQVQNLLCLFQDTQNHETSITNTLMSYIHLKNMFIDHLLCVTEYLIHVNQRTASFHIHPSHSPQTCRGCNTETGKHYLISQLTIYPYHLVAGFLSVGQSRTRLMMAQVHPFLP